MKLFLYFFVSCFSILLVISCVGCNGLGALIDIPSIVILFLGIFFTGINFKITDVFIVLLYPWKKKIILQRREYFLRIVQLIRWNIFAFSIMFFMISLFFIASISERYTHISDYLRAFAVSSFPLFYSIIISIFVLNPIQIAIKINQNKENG